LIISARLPTKLSALLSSAQLRQVYHVALGFEDSFLLTWLDIQGQDRIDSHGLPSELLEFLHARDSQHTASRNIPNIRCSLGPYNASFFAHDGSTYRWMNLPPNLLLALQDRIQEGSWIDRPRLVALGANDNFVLTTEKHTAIWDLRHYQVLANLLKSLKTQEAGLSSLRSIILHTYRFGSFITQKSDGSLIHENLPPHSTSGLQAMSAPILQDTKAAERKPLARRESSFKKDVVRRQSNLQQRAQLRRDWGEHKQHFTAQTKGMKVSLSLSVSINGLAKLLG
jgi:hypothetical protein